MERVKTGVPGLDQIMNGGIPKNQLMLLTGTSGTGKTILCSQYAYSGVQKYKENAVYLTFEEPSPMIRENMKKFGWDFAALEKAGKFEYIRFDPYRAEDILEALESSIRDIKAKRVVIDSVSALALHIRDHEELRRLIFNMSLMLSKINCTAIMVSEIVPGATGISRYGVEEFVSDSVVVMYYERHQSTFSRAIQVWKLRGSSHSQKLHPYMIRTKGISVSPDDEAFLS